MLTCRRCGAVLRQGETQCSSCGASVTGTFGAAEDLRGGEPEPLLEDGPASIESDAPVVPAGTWASTSDSQELAALERPAEAAEPIRAPKVRRLREVESSSSSHSEAGPSAREAEMRRERDDASRPIRTRARDAGRSRTGLAVARQQEEHEAPAPRPPAQVVAFPRSESASGVAAVVAPSNASASGLTPANAQPKWLASELLRERIDPEPLGWTARVVALGAGVGGAATAAMLHTQGLDLGTVVLFASVAAAAVVPVPFVFRAGGFAILGTLGLMLVTWLRSSIAGHGYEVLAIGGTATLLTGQLLRVVDRRSKAANVAMLLGVVAASAWLLASGGAAAMVVHGGSIEAWIDPALRALLMVILSLSLLGFLDPQSDSGCKVWAGMTIGWASLEAIAALVLDTPSAHVLATVACPLFSFVTAVGWVQTWTAFQTRRR